jgi:Double zinc ribbon
MSISFSGVKRSAKMRCEQCAAEIPADGRFCIECGAPAGQAATGVTERLPDYAGGQQCAACGTRNPPGAGFCVTCGRSLGARPVADVPAIALPPAPAPAALTSMPSTSVASVPAPRPRRSRFSVEWSGIMGGIWLIGIAVLAVTGWWWPGIMVLIGISALVDGLQTGDTWEQRWGGIQGAIWMFGIAVLAVTGWWWPGIMVLVGLSAILGAISRNNK